MLFNLIYMHLKLCLATATHNFKLVNITHICLFETKNMQIVCHITGMQNLT